MIDKAFKISPNRFDALESVVNSLRAFDAGAAAALPYAPLRWAEAVCTVAEA